MGQKYSAAVRAKRHAYARQWHADHPDLTYKYLRRAHLKRKYGITLEEYELLFEVAGGKCAICLRSETARRKGKLRTLCVDHDHATGAVRGLLCTSCNRAIGYLGDDPLRARALADYLERW